MVSVFWMIVVGAVCSCGGVILGAALSLGRQDDLMHALALLLENPADSGLQEHARRTLRG